VARVGVEGLDGGRLEVGMIERMRWEVGENKRCTEAL
jgi:hypothetical protein